MGEANEMIERIQRDKAIEDPATHKYKDEEFDLEWTMKIDITQKRIEANYF